MKYSTTLSSYGIFELSLYAILIANKYHINPFLGILSNESPKRKYNLDALLPFISSRRPRKCEKIEHMVQNERTGGLEKL